MSRRVAFVVVAVACAIGASAMPASAEGRPPRLDRFVARYNPTSTTTFYIAVAGDPDGGKLSYRWSIDAECGYLTDPETTGPSQGFQHGPPARRPDGCTNEQDRKATVTLRITDPEGCTIVYSQGARDETEHVAPPVQSQPCPPVDGSPAAAGDPPAAASGSFPVVPVLLVASLLTGLFIAARLRIARPATAGDDAPPWDDAPSRPDPSPAPVAAAPDPPHRLDLEQSEWFEPPRRRFEPRRVEPEPEPEPDLDFEPDPEPDPLSEPLFIRSSSADVLPTIRASESLIDDVPAFMDDDDEPLPSLFAEEPGPAPAPVPAAIGPAPCREGSIRKLDNDFVAHDTLLAGTVRARALRSGSTVDVPADDPAEILRLAAGMSGDAPLEVEVEIPLRLVTVVSTRREVCRGGVWVPEVESATHDGQARIERLRAIVTGPEELERFAQTILAKRLRTLTAAQRRLESALASMRGHE